MENYWQFGDWNENLKDSKLTDESTEVDIADVLEDLNLGQYLQLFLDEEIDFEVFLSMTDSDFEKIGIFSFGHRRKLELAIASYK